MEKEAKIYIAGHKGMFGSALVRALERRGYQNLLLRTSSELDLRNQQAVADFFVTEKPDYVFLAAAKVGGIKANMTFPVEFLLHNLQIQNNVIESSYKNGVKKICFLGSSCIYPKQSPQPMKEDYLLTGVLEETNEAYAIAKIAGLKLIQYYVKQCGMQALTVMPCNLYGPNDSFDLEHAHVLSSLVRRFVEVKNANANEITLWGTGVARREFMHIDDAAEATLHLFDNNTIGLPYINIGSGRDISIKELATMIAQKTGFTGNITWNSQMPDGTLRKCMDVSRMNQLGYTCQISLEQGVDQMIAIYKNLIQK